MPSLFAPRLSPVRRTPTSSLKARASDAARRGRRSLLMLVPALVAILALNHYRREIFGLDVEIRIATAVALMVIGWGIARGLGRIVQPRVARSLDPRATGISEWVVRLVALALTVLVSLRVAGLELGTLALGASFTAVVFGLAAQQTFGNVLAGLVLLSARPFEVGDRVRFAGFGMDVEGTIVSHGLLYVTCSDGADLVLVPNNTALTMSVRPIREPAAVDMRARLPMGIDPEVVQQRVQQAVEVATKAPPHVVLEEFDGDEVVVRIKATPVRPPEGSRLAREVLGAVTGLAAGEHASRREPVAA